MTERQSGHIKKAFLDAFRQHGNLSWACRSIKVGGRFLERSTVYKWQEIDDQFAHDFRIAEIEATEVMEHEAYRRGVVGVDEPVYQGGRAVGAVRKYSDTLLIFMLKARAPERYRETIRNEHVNPPDAIAKTEVRARSYRDGLAPFLPSEDETDE